MWLKYSLKTILARSWVPLTTTLIVEFLVFEAIGRYQNQPGFASISTIILILNQLSIFGIMAVGMTIVIISSGIDLSIGSVSAISGVLSAYIAVNLTGEHSSHILFAYLVGISAGLLTGTTMGTLIALLDIPPFIVTLAFMSLLRGLANILTGGKPISPLPENFLFIGRERLFNIVPLSIITFTTIFILGHLILNYTTYGRYTYAIGGNEEAARLSGVPIRKTKILIYTICSALSGLAGVILASRMGSGSPKVGIGDELAVIASVVIGGTSLSGGKGSLWGTLLGLCLVFTLNTGLNWIGIETFGQQVTLGLVILIAILTDKLQQKLK